MPVQITVLFRTILAFGRLPEDLPPKQPFWDRPGVLADRALVESQMNSPLQQASFLAASSSHSGDWLFALPIASCACGSMTKPFESRSVSVWACRYACHISVSVEDWWMNTAYTASFTNQLLVERQDTRPLMSWPRVFCVSRHSSY